MFIFWHGLRPKKRGRERKYDNLIHVQSSFTLSYHNIKITILLGFYATLFIAAPTYSFSASSHILILFLRYGFYAQIVYFAIELNRFDVIRDRNRLIFLPQKHISPFLRLLFRHCEICIQHSYSTEGRQQCRLESRLVRYGNGRGCCTDGRIGIACTTLLIHAENFLMDMLIDPRNGGRRERRNTILPALYYTKVCFHFVEKPSA